MNRRKWFLGVLLLLVIVAGLACHAWGTLHYRAAKRALVRHDLAEAQGHLASCLKVWWFRTADTYLLAARTARRVKELDQADNYLRACRELGGAEQAIDLEYKL